MSDYKILNRCLCCDSTDIEILLDLSNQPLANLYHDNTKEMDEYDIYIVNLKISNVNVTTTKIKLNNVNLK